MPEPPTISAISPRTRDPQRAAIHVDGKTVAVLMASTIEHLGLRIGTTWDEALDRRAAEAAAFDSAYQRAMQRLDVRARSRSEMEVTLQRCGHDQAVIERVLERLANLRAIDDEVLGRALIQETMARKTTGPLLLRLKLRRRGLSGELTERLLNEACQNVDLVAEASALANQRLASMSQLDARVQKERLWGLLARRGFETETIEAALADLAADEIF